MRCGLGGRSWDDDEYTLRYDYPGDHRTGRDWISFVGAL